MIHLLELIAIGYGVIAAASITYLLWEARWASHGHQRAGVEPLDEWCATAEPAHRGVRRPVSLCE